MSRCSCGDFAIPAQADVSATVKPTTRPGTHAEKKSENNYGQILKSSALVGGASVVKIAIGIVRTKAMAMLLGPTGFGLFGLYGAAADLSISIAGMGVNSSGVRQIAAAAGTGDTSRIGQTAAVLRRTSLLLGVSGAVLFLIFSRQISQLTFGNTKHASAVSLLSFVILLRLISDGQGALIQGMRRIGDLAKMNVWGAVLGAISSICLVYYFRQQGVVPSLIVVAATALITSWWYSRRVPIPRCSVTLAEVGKELSALLKLGFVFMSSGLMIMGTAYVVRIIILRKIGFEATGLYQSAWTLGGLYIGFILQAMGADFYPRLTASIGNHNECNRLVNEQTHVGLLLAGPGVLATLTLAPLVIALFYSAQFAGAVGVLRWICLGTTLQVISWPMGFIIVAKGNAKVFFLAELAWTIVAISLAYVCISYFGVNGAGMAFFGSYAFHVCLIYPIVHHFTKFSWSKASMHATLFFLSLIALVFSSFYVFPVVVSASIGGLATIVGGVYSIRVLSPLLSSHAVPPRIQRLIARFDPR